MSYNTPLSLMTQMDRDGDAYTVTIAVGDHVYTDYAVISHNAGWMHLESPRNKKIWVQVGHITSLEILK